MDLTKAWHGRAEHHVPRPRPPKVAAAPQHARPRETAVSVAAPGSPRARDHLDPQIKTEMDAFWTMCTPILTLSFDILSTDPHLACAFRCLFATAASRLTK